MITEIVTHGSPAHLDELMAMILLRDYGEEKLPGVSVATFRYLTKDDNLEELTRREDVVLLGVGASFRDSTNAHRIFDEHVADGDKSQKDDCAATLAAKFLGLDQEFRWRKILKYVLHTDKNPPNLTLDLSATVMRFQHQGWGLHAVVGRVEPDLHAMLTEQGQFANISMESIQEEELTINGEKHWMAVIEGDDYQAPGFARMFGATVVVVKNPNGQVQVLTNNSLRLDMRDVLRILRSREEWTRGNRLNIQWRELEQEGTLTEYPTWFFHKDANNILNGGHARPDIPPTKLTLPDVIDAVKIGLERNRFEPRRQEKCQQGICTSTPKNPCQWYNLGLLRCRTVRAKTYRASQ